MVVDAKVHLSHYVLLMESKWLSDLYDARANMICGSGCSLFLKIFFNLASND